MLIFKSKYVMVITEAWIQEDFFCLNIPILGTSITGFPLENGAVMYNITIPILFFDIVIMCSTKPMIYGEDIHGS